MIIHSPQILKRQIDNDLETLLPCCTVAAFAVPLPYQLRIASSQGLSSEEVRVISLPGAGNDRADAVPFSRMVNTLPLRLRRLLFDSQTLSNEKFIYMGNLVRTLAFSPQGKSLAAGLLTRLPIC